MSLASPSARRALSAAWLLRAALSVLAGSALLTLAAHVKVPFWPVPMTMQTFVVFMLGALLGPFVGPAAVLAYVAEGLAGLPVFAGGVGAATVMGPTGGYLLGFVAAAAFVGAAARRGWLARTIPALGTFLAADAILFILGVAWLATLIGWDKAMTAGVVPFLLGEALKIGLATAACVGLYQRR